MLRRITLLAIGTALVAVTLLAVPLGILAGRRYVDDERLELQRTAVGAAAAVRTDQLGAGVSTTDSETDVAVYDVTGRVVAGRVPGAVDALVGAALAGHESSRTSDYRISVATPVSDGDRVIAAVVLSSDLGAAHARALRAWLVIAALGFAAVALSGIGARLVGRRFTRPIHRLTDTAERIGNGDLTARATTSGIGELDTLVLALNDSTEQLATLMLRERQFSEDVSHQLRTPLSGLRLELEAAQAEHPQDANVRNALRAVDRLDVTIDEVIRLARGLGTATSIAVGQVITAVEARWQAPLAAVSRRLRVVAEVAADQPLAISREAAAQILDVLIDNARAHGAGAITVRIRAADTNTTIAVSDEGPPLRAESHEVFLRRQDGQGHGIGLSFARKLAESEGARLVLASADPPTFALVLPA